MKTVFVMKYSLTAGIIEAEVVDDSLVDASLYTRVYNSDDMNGKTFLQNKDVRPDRESALRAFEELRARKITSLLKQVKKLEKLEPKFMAWKKREES